MYNDIGKKIKKLTKIVTVLFIVISFIMGFIMAIRGSLLFLVFIFAVPILLYLSSFVMYGFGELIDKVCDIERNTRDDTYESTPQVKKENEDIKQQDEKIKKLDELRAEGLISEKEYRDEISKGETL